MVEGEGSMTVKPVDVVVQRSASEGEESDQRYPVDILPPLGASSPPSQDLGDFVISPFDRRYRSWEVLLVVLVFYTAWVSPFEFGFLSGPTWPLNITDNVVNSFFLVDIVMSFFVAYLDKSTYNLVIDHKQIALKYAKTGLLFDVISSMPYELIHKIMHNVNAYGYFNMLRLWRIRRVSSMFERMEKDTNINYTVVRTVKLTCGTLFSIHVAACGFYSLATRNKDPLGTWIGAIEQDFQKFSLFHKYVISMYLSTVTVATLGYGDYHAVTRGEMIYTIIFVLYILGLTSYIIGNFTNLIVESTNKTRKFRETINAASSFGKRNNIPEHMQDLMIAHLSLKYRIDAEGVQQQETIDSLPKAIRSKISQFLFYSLVDTVYLFEGVSNDLLFQLVSIMKPEYFPNGEDIILQNETPTDMYILVNGAADFISHINASERVVGVMKTGDVCGEVGLLCYRPQVFTVRTKRLSQLLRLNRTALMNVLQNNVGDATIIMNNLLEHLKGHQDPAMQEILTHTEQILAKGRFDMPLSLCFAADRGDALLLIQMLRKGMDPDELDSNGRRALNLAASKGFLECVLLLLDFGADPNSKDSEGNVPLWDAMLGKHDDVIKALSDNGATLPDEDIGYFACSASEQNNTYLLQALVNFGGDISQPDSHGNTALHLAINRQHVEICKFLVENGADTEKPDADGWTPRALANYLHNEEIKALLQTNSHHAEHKSDPPQQPAQKRVGTRERRPYSGDVKTRRGQTHLSSSLAGIITAVQRQSGCLSNLGTPQRCARVTLSCPEKGDTSGKLVLLPGSIAELVEVGCQKFDFRATKVATKDGYLVEDMAAVRDGDHLVLAGGEEKATIEL
ncbi:potassium channel AKT1-like [Salvia splendens]|uniref:potassium channel AKT1-like n=1 Tax=Salvia splendens TaxID=180675 RepID=UPI001C253F6C|nr:potassium channel AKT1-like [Salvia splendens]